MPSNMRCAVCGKEIKESANFCNKCGNAIPNRQILLQKTELVSHTENMPNENLNTDLLRRASDGKGELNINVNISRQESEFAPYLRDEPSFGFALLGFLFPYVGLVVYFIIKGEKPLKARSCIKGVIWSFVLGIIFFMFLAGLGVM
jgi:hypothetical protein